MSKADKIQNVIWKAYGKVGKLLGRDFEIYRSVTLSDPIIGTNYIDTKQASFSLDNKYGKAHDGGLSLWNCWVDARLEDLFELQQGDILRNSLNEETYIIASVQEHLPIRAIKAESRITISRVEYTNATPSDADIAVSVPCSIQQPSSADGSLGYVPGANNANVGIPNYQIDLWDPELAIQIGDAVTDQNGNRSQVLAVYSSDMGTKLVTTAYNA